MRIYIGADHRGFFLKEALKHYLAQEGYEVSDEGAHEYNQEDDYPDFTFAVAEKVAGGSGKERGIIMCYTGQGEVIAANKVKGVRAALAWDKEVATLSRQHNDANVLVLPAGFIKEEKAKAIVKGWLTTAFSGEPRHVRRIEKITQYEKDNTA